MTPESAVVIVMLLCLLVVGVWDMRNTSRQARYFMRRHGLKRRGDSK